MVKQAKLTLEVLKPLVDQGFKTRKISKLTGFPIRMVDRRLRALGLRKPKPQPRAMPPRSFDTTAMQKSRDPILSNTKQFKLSQIQSEAAIELRSACTDGVGVKAIDLERMLQRSGGGSGGLTGSERAAVARARLEKWKARCKLHRVKGAVVGIDIMPAILIAGHGISVRQAAIMLGMHERIASDTCKKTLDVYAEMRGWHHRMPVARIHRREIPCDGYPLLRAGNQRKIVTSKYIPTP
jgi:hypothetical protein